MSKDQSRDSTSSAAPADTKNSQVAGASRVHPPELLAVQSRLRAVQEQIEAATLRRGPGRAVRLIGVSKFQPLEKLVAAYEAGLRDFGENYVQELCAKQEQTRAQGLLGQAKWHFIGKVQRNKIKRMLDCDFIHTIDRAEALEELDRRAAQASREISCLIEVNGGEAQKGGIAPDQLPALLDRVAQCTNVVCCGLMLIPPDLDAQQVRPMFASLRELAQKEATQARPRVQLDELSMGMSDDFCEAILEGATMVRVGSAIFGARS